MNHFLSTCLFCSTILLVAGCSKENKPNMPMSRPAFVHAQEVNEQSVPVYIETIGNVYPRLEVALRPQIEGMLKEVYVIEGEHVKKGQLLCKIDTRPYEAALNKVKATLAKDEAQLDFATKKRERYKELVEQEYISKISYDQYVSEEKTAKAQVMCDKEELVTAQINLEYCTIHAPIDGKVSDFSNDPGNIISPRDEKPLTQIRQLSPVEIQFKLPQNEFQKIQKVIKNNDIEFEVLLPNEDVYPHKGKINFIDNQMDLSTGTIVVKGIVPNEEECLWPGEFIRVRIFLQEEPHALVVPSTAIQMGQKGNFVYGIKPDNTVETLYVKVGDKIGDLVVIKEGLQLGQKVVTDGQLNLYSGAQVIVQPTEMKSVE